VKIKQYFFVGDAPPSPVKRGDGWSVNPLHATAFLTRAEGAIGLYKIADAEGCEKLYDYWYIFRNRR
jgi:hypothetical protein